jgi:D-serine dehydratase
VTHPTRLHPPLDLRSIEEEPLRCTWKNTPRSATGLPLRELGGLALSLFGPDMPMPAAVLRQSALSHNVQWMSRFAERTGVSLCPHGKTTMAPQIFDLQLQFGAWGMTAATAAHVRTYRQFGVQRILLANQLVGRSNVEMVVAELNADANFDFYCLVDSHDGLRHLLEVLREHPCSRPVQVLLEVGAAGGRTGVRTLEEGLALARTLRTAWPTIALRGIEAFEGVFGGNDPAVVEAAVTGMLETLATLARMGAREGWFAPGEVILSAGGSSQFDLVATRLAGLLPDIDTRTVLRSGCYVTHDVGHYERMQQRMRQRSPQLWEGTDGLSNAIELWSTVQSIPEPRRVICGFGRRDASFDMDLPIPLWWYRPGEHARPVPAPPGLRTAMLYDQHALLDLDVGAAPFDLRTGDLLGFGIAHPCTTFDKWPLLHLVDDDYAIVGGVRTFF